jgi:hypothetical protein
MRSITLSTACSRYSARSLSVTRSRPRLRQRSGRTTRQLLTASENQPSRSLFHAPAVTFQVVEESFPLRTFQVVESWMRPSTKPASVSIDGSDRREHCSRPAAAYTPAVGVRLRHSAPTGETKVVAWPLSSRVVRHAAASRCSSVEFGVTGRHGCCYTLPVAACYPTTLPEQEELQPLTSTGQSANGRPRVRTWGDQASTPTARGGSAVLPFSKERKHV